MAGLGSLYIDLLARTGKFETDIGRAARVAEKRAKEIDRSFRRLGSRIAGALGGVAAGLSLGAIVEETAKAERALAALDNAVKNNAGAAGLTTRQLADMSSELQRLTIYGDDTIQGMQALLLTFRQIGGPEFQRAQVAVLDLATALGKDLNSSALLVGRALANPVKGMAQLSRAGVVLTEAQQNLIKKLAETGKTAEAQDVLLTQLESRFGGAARAARDTFGGAIEGLRNAFGDLLESKSGLRATTSAINDLTDALSSPEVASAADSLSSAAVSSISAIGKAAAVALKPLAEFINYFGDLGALIDNKLFGRQFSEAEFTRIFGVDPRGTGPTRRGRVSSGPAVDTPSLPSEEFTKLADKLKEQIALYGKVGEAAKISYAIQTGALDEMSKAEQQQLLALARRYDAIVQAGEAEKEAIERQKAAQEEWQKLLEQGARITESVRTPTEIYKEALQELKDALDLGVISQETFNRALQKAQDELVPTADAIAEFAQQNSESLSQSLEAFSDSFEERYLKASEMLTIFQEQAARNTQDIIADTLMDGFDQGVDGILRSFGEMIQKLIAQAVAADIAKRLFGSAGGGTGDGWVGVAMQAMGTYFGGGRAIGGPVLAGVTYRVNEREPEFFRPRVGGDIIPLSKMPNMGGGTVINQNFSVRSETGDRVTRRTEQQIAAAASRGIAVASRRNN